jgi:hypothetical protein
MKRGFFLGLHVSIRAKKHPEKSYATVPLNKIEGKRSLSSSLNLYVSCRISTIEPMLYTVPSSASPVNWGGGGNSCVLQLVHTVTFADNY